MTRKARERGRAEDLALCLLAAIGLAAAMLAIGLWIGGEAFVRWGGLAAFSALMFWAVIRTVQEVKKQGLTRAFLIFNLFFAAAHCAGWIILLSLSPIWKIPWFALMAPEAILYLWLYAELFHEKRWRRHAAGSR